MAAVSQSSYEIIVSWVCTATGLLGETQGTRLTSLVFSARERNPLDDAFGCKGYMYIVDRWTCWDSTLGHGPVFKSHISHIYCSEHHLDGNDHHWQGYHLHYKLLAGPLFQGDTIQPKTKSLRVNHPNSNTTFQPPSPAKVNASSLIGMSITLTGRLQASQDRSIRKTINR